MTEAKKDNCLMTILNRRTLPALLKTSLWLGLTAFAARAVLDRYAEFIEKGRFVPSFLLITALLVGGSAFVLTLIWGETFMTRLAWIKRRLGRIRVPLAAAVCLMPLILYAALPWSEPYGAPAIRAYLYALFFLTAVWITDMGDDAKPAMSACVAMAFLFAVSAILIQQFRLVSSYPFSVGWSEGNRFWDYSVLFGRRLYDWAGEGSIPAYIDLGRQSLWGAIFILPKVSIRMMRAWNGILFTVPYILLGWALLRKNDDATDASRVLRLSAMLWTMLFLNQGPIYTPLVIAIAIVAAARKLPLALNLVLVAAAGAYAVMSRSTWLIAPPLFAAALAFVETRDKKRRWGMAILLAVVAFTGAFAYLKRDLYFPAARTPDAEREIASQAIEADAIEKDPAARTDMSVETLEASPAMFSPDWVAAMLSRQPLLWNRLLPNETYRPGILLGLLTAILPLCALLMRWTLGGGWKIDRTTGILIGLMLIGLMMIGLLISVKIGGGSNLHNLDIFLIALLLVAALAWNGGFGDWLAAAVRQNDRLISAMILAAILIPALSAAFELNPKVYPPEETTVDALNKINEAIDAVGGENVLFIDQRQLLTFGDVPRIPLIADYEKKWMMDEAMADNAEWFAPYRADLKARRFSVIISEPLQIKFQGAALNFSEENDLFVKHVSIPTLCYYEPVETFPEQGVQILVPRAEAAPFDGAECP